MIARQRYPQNDGPWFARPPEVINRRICTLTGLPASPDCPETSEGVAIRGKSSPLLCQTHRLSLDGRSKTSAIGMSAKLSISKPENDAVFNLVSGNVCQKIVCQTVGNLDEARLWWFVDDCYVGESFGNERFLVDMKCGEHVISCSTQEGRTAQVHVKVESP